MTSYYEDTASGITIYHGDCHEFLPMLDYSLIVTDPPYCEMAAKRLAQSVLFSDGAA